MLQKEVLGFELRGREPLHKHQMYVLKQKVGEGNTFPDMRIAGILNRMVWEYKQDRHSGRVCRGLHLTRLCIVDQSLHNVPLIKSTCNCYFLHSQQEQSNWK